MAVHTTKLKLTPVRRAASAVMGVCLVGGLCMGVAIAQSITPAMPTSAVAAGTAAPMVGLVQAYELALANDANLKAARAQADGVAERIVQARASLYPNVSVGASRFFNDLSRTQNNILGVPTSVDERYFSYSQTLQVRQPLYRPALGLGVDQARAQHADALALFAREAQSLGIKVVEAYLQVLLAQENLALLDAQHRLTVQQFESAKKRFEGGAGIRTDIDETQARLDIVEAQQLAARQTRQTALLQLQLMLQQPINGVLALDPLALKPASFNAMTVDDWLARATEKSPDLVALRARLDAARLEVRKAEASHKPTLDAVAQITRSGSENVTSPQSSYINRQVGLQFNLPLYAGGAVQSMVRQALAEQARIEETMEAIRRDLHIKLQNEWRGVTEGAMRMAALERAVASSDQVIVSVQKSFQAGMRTVLDVLNAEQQAQQSRRDLAEARLGYVASRMRLLSLTGELDVEQLSLTTPWFPVR